MATNSKVFVVDDDAAARESVAALVQSKGLEARTFPSAEEFLAAMDPNWRGCLVLDVRMPGMSGLDLQQQLKRDSVSLPVIVITAHGNIPMAVQAMRAGAVTFLEKPCDDQDLWTNIRAGLEWENRTAQAGQQRKEIEERMAQLSDDERKVLDLLVAGRPNKVIATELDLGLRTVELRRANIMKKLHANSLAELVRLTLELERP